MIIPASHELYRATTVDLLLPGGKVRHGAGPLTIAYTRADRAHVSGPVAVEGQEVQTSIHLQRDPDGTVLAAPDSVHDVYFLGSLNLPTPRRQQLVRDAIAEAAAAQWSKKHSVLAEYREAENKKSRADREVTDLRDKFRAALDAQTLAAKHHDIAVFAVGEVDDRDVPDLSSSASRQHYIDTGRYLSVRQVEDFGQ